MVDRNEIIDLIKAGTLDDLKEFEKMNKQEQEDIITYWQKYYKIYK